MLTGQNSQILKQFLNISKVTGEGLTHFIQANQVKKSSIQGEGRFILNDVYKNELIAVIGGVLVNASADPQITLPISPGFYLNQVSMDHRVTVNHSCSANLVLRGFNKLVAKRDLKANEELTLDYGTVFIGKGKAIIENCYCGSVQCRKTIRTSDYLQLPQTDLGVYFDWAVKNSKEANPILS